MTDAVTIAIIGGIVSTIGVIVAGVIAVKLKNVEQKIDGRLTELLEITRADSKKEGNKEGIAEGKEIQKQIEIDKQK